MGQELRARVLLELRDRLRGPAGKARDRLKEISGTARALRKDMRGASAGSDRLGRSMKSTARETLKAARSQNQLINEFRSLKGGAQQLKAKLDQTQTKMSALAKEGKKTGTEFAALGRKASNLKRQLGQQNERLELARRKLKDTGVATKGLGSAQRSAKSAIQSTTSALEAQSRELKRTERRLQALDRLTEKRRDQRNRIAGIGLGMGAAGIGGMYAGKRIARPVQSSAMEFAGFEEQMDAVAAIARVSQNSQTYKDLSGKARELGGSTSFSAQEVASAMQFQAMAGFSPDQILASIADVLDLAKATGTDLASTSDISSNIMSAFGLDPSEMQRVADVLTAVTTRANVDLTMLGESMKYVGPEAKSLGISMEEAAAMAGLLGNVGIQGSQAGTSLRAIYQRLAAPAKAGADAMKKIGLEARDAQGNLRSVPDLLLEIGEATKNMGDAERKEIFKDIIGMEAGSSFSALIDEGGYTGFTKLLADLGNVKGEANRVATQMGDNWNGDLKSLNSAVSEVSLTLGDQLNPALRDVTQYLTQAARDTAAWMKEHPRLTKWIGFTVLALAGLLVVGGALLTFLGTAMLWSAGLKYGLFMLGASAVRSGGALGLLGSAFKGLSKLKPLRWAMFIPKLVWRMFVTPFKWAAHIAKLSWRGLVSVLRWLSFIPKIAWRSFLPALKWSSLVGKLSWRLLITPLKWSARLIPGIGWALLAGELLWSLLIKPFGWDEYIPSFSWGDRFSVLDWSTWVPEVDLSEKGRQAIQSLWDGAVEMFDQFIAFISSIPSKIVSAFGSVDLSNAIKLPSLSSLWGGGEAKATEGGAPGYSTVDGFAKGGTVRSTGPILVGERGPELRYGSKGQFIAHNRQLRQMANLAKAGKRIAAGTVAAASLSGAVAAEPAAPLLPQIAAHGGSTGGTLASAPASGTGSSAAGQTINNNTFNVTIQLQGGGTAEDDGRKAADAFVRRLNKRLTD